MGFLGSFFGKDQRNDLNAGYRESQARLDQGYADQKSAITAGRDNALSYLSPYIQGGQRGQTAYENTLGLNGAPARQQQFQTGYLDDPALAYRDQATGNQINALLRKYNAGPQGVNSGAAALGSARIRAENFNNDWGGYQNRLMQLGQQGGQFATQGAQITYGAGKDLGDAAMGYGNTSAANRINIANAQAANRNTGINNLISVGSAAARAIAAGATGGLSEVAQAGIGAMGGGQYRPGAAWTNPDTGRVRY